MASPFPELRIELSDNVSQCVHLYFRVKALVVAAERSDKEHKISISCVAELRSAYDHLMRIEKALLISPDECLNPNSSKNTEEQVREYCATNFSKIRGHLYRAGYDAYDAISISLLAEVRQMIESLPADLLLVADREAAKKVFAVLKEAEEALNDAKCRKDIESEQDQLKYFELYEGPCNQLEDLRKHIVTLMPAIAGLKSARSKNEWKQRIIGFAFGILLLFVGLFIKGRDNDQKSTSSAVPANQVPSAQESTTPVVPTDKAPSPGREPSSPPTPARNQNR
jgi:hypothetical protein